MLWYVVCLFDTDGSTIPLAVFEDEFAANDYAYAIEESKIWKIPAVLSSRSREE